MNESNPGLFNQFYSGEVQSGLERHERWKTMIIRTTNPPLFNQWTRWIRCFKKCCFMDTFNGMVNIPHWHRNKNNMQNRWVTWMLTKLAAPILVVYALHPKLVLRHWRLFGLGVTTFNPMDGHPRQRSTAVTFVVWRGRPWTSSCKMTIAPVLVLAVQI